MIVIEAGGPGTAISQTKYGYFDSLLGDLPETFDIVLIDQRGVGKSEAIDCEDLEQAVTTEQRYQAAAACRRSLGDRAGLFSTRAVADDIDSVRGALGVDKINLFGNSYAGNDVVTYAVRHRAHVRSVVTTSAELTPGEDTFWGSIPRSLPRITRTLCVRSASCAAAVASPTSELTWLASTLRRTPLNGAYVDGEGTRHDCPAHGGQAAELAAAQPGLRVGRPRRDRAGRARLPGRRPVAAPAPGRAERPRAGPGGLRPHLLLDRSQPGPPLRGRAVPVDQVGEPPATHQRSTHGHAAPSRTSMARSRRTPGCARTPPVSRRACHSRTRASPPPGPTCQRTPPGPPCPTCRRW